MTTHTGFKLVLLSMITVFALFFGKVVSASEPLYAEIDETYEDGAVPLNTGVDYESVGDVQLDTNAQAAIDDAWHTLGLTTLQAPESRQAWVEMAVRSTGSKQN